MLDIAEQFRGAGVGDEATLRLLVNDISRRRGGRPVRWLGDGGMFHFPEPWAAVAAGLDMVERAPATDLPLPTWASTPARSSSRTATPTSSPWARSP